MTRVAVAFFAVLMLLAGSVTAQPICPGMDTSLPGFSVVLDQAMDRVEEIKTGLGNDKAEYERQILGLAREYGTRPMKSIAYLTNLGGEVGRAAMTAAARTGVDPTFLSVVLFQEGLNIAVESGNYLAGNGKYDPKTFRINGFVPLGADSFYTRIPDLKRRGFLRPDYNGAERILGTQVVDPIPKEVLIRAGIMTPAEAGDFPGVQVTNGQWRNEPTCSKYEGKKCVAEKEGDLFPAFRFKGFEAAAEGVAAMLALNRSLFLADAKKFGIDTSTMTQGQLEQWTYLYYNMGEGNGRKRLQSTGGNLPKARGSDGKNPYFNAGRVGATVALYRKYEVFQPCGTNGARPNATTATQRIPGASGSMAAGTER